MAALTLSEWKDLAETVEHFAVALGVVAGGGWALYTFIRLRMIENAKLQVEEKLKALHESAVLQATISAEQIAIGTSADYYIAATVSVVNVGNVETAIRYDEALFFVSEISVGEKGNLVYGDIISGSFPNPLNQRLVGTTIPLKYTCRIPYVFKVKKEGLYLICFRAKDYGEDNRPLDQLRKAEPRLEVYCKAYLFFAVSEHKKGH